ncbi:PAS domain S-box-containing protein [Halovenus aranensis]|uniref:PAS domain S-box-containing protein n=1 Tax=Halovenus aranensis TaxID=890420 RepID=A0A1G8YLW6_9EURY|nr:ATP-binding protein [Halovenus aranensis]SDK03736.1 PAS domain S-box-containing protein [Halovenus aranensis]
MVRTDSLCVLVVDDSDFFVSMLADKLTTEYGITTKMATNADDALAELRDSDIDCIVSDYEMPETSGLELFEMVDANVPFVLLTAQGDESTASRAISMGVDDYLLKEAVMEKSLDLLVNRIQNVVEQRRTQRKYEQLIDNTPDGIAQLSPDGEILAANEAAATEFGVAQSDLVGRQLSAFLPEDVAAGRLEECERALATDNAVTFQDSVGVRHFHNIAVPLSTVGEESIQLVSREITHQKHNERKLERKNESLAMINRIVRHDINNDLQLLVSWSERLEDHVDDTGRTFLDRIQDTSDHIAELTATARDFVESLDGDDDPDLEPVALRSVLETEIEKKRASYGEASISVDTLPQVSVRANELLSSVFGNLLSNAVRHNESDNPTVTVSAEEIDTEVRVRIADNGPGIPDEHKRDIFGKGAMDPDSPGTGLGLFLVSTLVDQYNGSIWAEDNEPSGAAFVVELPTTDQEPQDSLAADWT